MKQADKDQLAKKVSDAHTQFILGLTEKRAYPRKEFGEYFKAFIAYTEAVKNDEMIHRTVASDINGLVDYLEVERKRVPGEVLMDASRMACILFCGYDPHFVGDEPPDC